MRWKMLLCHLRFKWGLFSRQKRALPCAYTTARHVAIVSNTYPPDVVLRFLESLKQENKEVHVIFYPSNKLSTHESFVYFSEKSLSFWGVLHSEAIDKFIAQEYDIMINTSQESSILIEQLCYRINAKLKATICTGTSDTDYDLLVREAEIGKSLDVLQKYLKTFAKLA